VTDASNLAGLKLGNYRLRRVLGRGNMGVVYLATDEALLRPTAVKVLAWSPAEHDPEAWFLAEARSVARLNHPSVIQIYSVARHGPHHELLPSEIPARANIAALRHLGVRCIIAFSAAGSLAEEVRPRDFVVPDQIIDRTKGVRPHTFFEDGFVLHMPFADPFDGKVGDVVRRCGHSLEGEGVRLHDKGCLIVMGGLSLLFLFRLGLGLSMELELGLFL